MVSDIDNTIFMASNRVTGPLNLSMRKWIRPLEIVFNGFWKDDTPLIKKLPVEVGIPEWLCMKGLEKEAAYHERKLVIGN